MATQVDVASRRDIISSRIRKRANGEPDLSLVPRFNEEIIRAILFFCGVVSIFTTIGIVIVLSQEAFVFFFGYNVTVAEFFGSTTWRPAAEPRQVGVWALLNATLLSSAIAMLVALPLGLGAAIYLSEYAPPKLRDWLKPVLEILAGIPTVVYGYFALTFMTPVLRGTLGENIVEPFNLASAGLVMGIMILPTVSSMSEDALAAVPRALREASYGLGATRFETIGRVVLPAAVSGLAAAFIVGVARAVGETMIVALAAGSRPFFTFNPFVAAETMTGHIARISQGDLPFDTIQYSSLFAIGLTLFVATLGLNLLARWVSVRFREVY